MRSERTGFLERTELTFPPCAHPPFQCLCLQLSRPTGHRNLSKLLKLKPSICSETSSAVRPRQTSAIMAVSQLRKALMLRHSELTDATCGAKGDAMLCTPTPRPMKSP